MPPRRTPPAARGAAFFVAALLVAACGAPPTQPPATQATSVVSASVGSVSTSVSRVAARAAVERFVGRSAAVFVADPVATEYGYCYEVRGTGRDAMIYATVEVSSGRVTSLLLGDLMPRTKKAGISKDEARRLGEAFLAEHDVPSDGLAAEVTLEDHGGFAEYRVVWRPAGTAGRSANRREVSLDPSSGRVFAFVDVRPPVAAA